MRAHTGTRAAAWVLAVLAATAGCGNDSGGESTLASTALPTSTTVEVATPRVVVDTDLAADDLVALAFLLSSDDVDVAGITVAGTGEVRCPKGEEIVRRFLEKVGHPAIPVACGRATPLAGNRAFPTGWRDAADDAWSLQLPSPSWSADGRTAVELLLDLLEPGGATLLTLGPLTNVAEAFRSDPAIAAKVESIVMMGGAVDVPGNVFDEGPQPPVAEWNVYVDPVAADEVVTSGTPIVMVGLDATNDAPITVDFLELLGANAHTAAAEVVQELLVNNPMVYTGEAYFWDPLAAGVIVDPPVVGTEDLSIAVTAGDDPTSGRTARSDTGTAVAVGTSADRERFEQLFVRTLDGLASAEDIVSPPTPVATLSIHFDGTACTFDPLGDIGPGRLRFTFDSPDPGSGAAVLPMTGEASLEEIIAWVAANPEGGEPPGITQPVGAVAPDNVQFVDVTVGTKGVVCVDVNGRGFPAGTFDVG